MGADLSGYSGSAKHWDSIVEYIVIGHDDSQRLLDCPNVVERKIKVVGC